MVVVFLALGIRQTTGLLLGPMTSAHGWTREAFSFAFALQNLVWGIALPFFGYMADRFGSARAIALGAAFYGLGLLLMRGVTTPLGLDFASGVLIGLGLAGASFGLVLSVVSRHAPPAKRSAALGLTAAGGSLGQFIMLPVGQQLISRFEWSGALLAFAALSALMMIAAMGLSGRGTDGVDAREQSTGEALREAWAHPSFHLIFWSFFTCGFHTAFVILHFPVYITDAKLSLQTAVTATALIGLFNVVGTYVSGLLGGRFQKRKLLAWIYILRAIVFAVFLYAPKTSVTVYTFACVIGLLWLGTVPLTNGLIAHIYGTRFVSMLSGIIFFGHQIGSFLGAWLGGFVYDRYGTYDPVWLLAVIIGLTAAALSWPVDERPIAAKLPPLKGATA